MSVVSTSHIYLRLLASNTLGTTCLAICMFTSTHAKLSFDRGTLTRKHTHANTHMHTHTCIHTHAHTGEGLIAPMQLI